MQDYKLLLELLNNSYSPYSKFRVAAIIKMKDGNIIKGVNIENVSYGISMCAERVALGNMYSNGYKKDDASYISILSDSNDYITPCGACRQALIELLNEDTIINLYSKKGDKIEMTIQSLLPNSFRSLLWSQDL